MRAHRYRRNPTSSWSRHLRDIGVFQGQPAEVEHAHGGPTTDEDEERDELPAKERGTQIRKWLREDHTPAGVGPFGLSTKDELSYY